MLLIVRFILCLTKDSKVRKIHYFLLENRVSLFIPDLIFFPQINTKKKLYANVPEMSNFNPKTSILKYPIFCIWYNVFHC